MVMDALEKGNKPTAKAYGTTVKTVRKWARKYLEQGIPGLREQSRAPHHIPHKTPLDVEERLVARKKVLKGFGVERMIKEFEMGCGKGSALRILKERGLLKPRKKKRQRRNDLRDEKAQWPVGAVQCVDTKDLSDIPGYWTQMKRLNLPSWQYTHREVRSGLLFLGYASEKSLLQATVFEEWITAWEQEHGMELRDTRLQTDGGSEFIGSWCAQKKSSFIKALESKGIRHFQIPKTTYNADVETVHHLIELEFFDIESFHNREDFFIKASTYQRWFNILRRNSHKWNKTPLDIIREADPRIGPAIATLPALDLDNLAKRKINHMLQSNPSPPGGYYLPDRTVLVAPEG